ncbi:ent-kaurene oxidase [Annulohypoxylon truncatum]|uniref:ent-kaurene oxidase n=1 Tax=Annulohypoxylon truncatum TaxID=327061 RepID=UPI002007EC47|nr:ent-kaurene oxidase [Annulohypoxylon truncatum]KAI1204700.1 ent-kaurene oxidase [Annulohypoxylon truncatum]
MELSHLCKAHVVLPSIAITILLWFLKSIKVSHHEKLLKSSPSVGLGTTWLSWPFALLKSLTRTRELVFQGYSDFSKSNRFFVLPTIDRGGLLVIPPRQIKRLYGLPEDVLDVKTTGNNTIQTRWTVWDDEVAENNFQMNVIRHQITRNLNILTPPIAEELAKGFDREWGTDTKSWKTISVWTSALRLIAGAANGAFCGAPLCRNEDFLTRLRDHAMCVFAGALIINSTPGPIRWISGYLIGWTSYFLFLRVCRVCLPFVKQRLENTAKLRLDPTFPWTPPEDGLQWIIDECYATNEPAQLDPVRVTHRLVFMNDISMHSTSYTVQNVILDLAAADPSLGHIESLREESARVLKEAGGSWTRQAVTKLKLVDSVVRESMHLSPFNSVGLPRTVIDPHGVTVQQGESIWNIPQGTILTIPVEPIHYDDSIYPGAKQFQPFRFAQPGAVRDIVDHAVEASASESGHETMAKGLAPSTPGFNSEQKQSATIDDAFLGFGFGKHACPGRFFALNEVKIFVAHMVLHYDIEHLKEGRARMTPLIWLNIPLFNNINVRVRRREPVY